MTKSKRKPPRHRYASPGRNPPLEKAVNTLLDHDPSNWKLRYLLADLIMALGDRQLAEGYLYLTRHGLYPVNWNQKWKSAAPSGRPWQFYNARQSTKKHTEPHAVLPIRPDTVGTDTFSFTGDTRWDLETRTALFLGLMIQRGDITP
jgi:hypothetical protein